ncbi:hypothetical protein HanPSC8_Chr12g0536551 [Helianthus annuus]|nr:hypothetical protein HanPSC8_Chr12g0536551 [Helianthus annuus]
MVEDPTCGVIPVKEKRKETETAVATKHDKAQGPEVVRITGLDQPFNRKEAEVIKPKEPEVVKPTEPTQRNAPAQTIHVTSVAGGSTATVPEQAAHKEISAAAGGAGAGGSGGVVGVGAAGQKGVGSQGSMPQAPIGPKDTLGDIYYKTYTEEARGDTPHQPVWGLKQDTFVEFGACRDWYLGSFPPGEVNRQRARTHEGLYRAYIVEEANTRAANHQNVLEWRTMMKSAFAEENAAFEAEKKSEEWGRKGLKNKLHAAEELLSKERAEWKKVCEKDNRRMYAARSKITDLEAQIATLKGKVEQVEANKGRVEADLNARKDKELAAKDVEIAELKRRLFEAHDKNESLEIDLEAERVKAETAEEAKKKAEEARDISTSALNVAQNNYAEAQTIVDTLVSESEWMRSKGVPAIANSILNAIELDTAVATLIDASRAVGHRGGYLECAQHVEEVFGQQFDTHHCSVTNQADSMLSRAKEVYDHISLPVMELVTDVLKHDNWCARLKFILKPPETVELTDEEDEAGGDGNGYE